MEPKSETIVTIKPANDGTTKKKSRGAMQIFTVALFMLRRRSKKSNPIDTDTDKSSWRRLLGSMRPLHIQSNEPSLVETEFIESPPPQSSLSSSSPLSPLAPSRSSSFSTNQYASAINLRELDDNNDDDDDNGDREEVIRVDDQNGGDEMIDAKAEEFIAKFYEQMRLQRYNIY